MGFSSLRVIELFTFTSSRDSGHTHSFNTTNCLPHPWLFTLFLSAVIMGPHVVRFDYMWLWVYVLKHCCWLHLYSVGDYGFSHLHNLKVGILPPPAGYKKEAIKTGVHRISRSILLYSTPSGLGPGSAWDWRAEDLRCEPLLVHGLCCSSSSLIWFENGCRIATWSQVKTVPSVSH